MQHTSRFVFLFCWVGLLNTPVQAEIAIETIIQQLESGELRTRREAAEVMLKQPELTPRALDALAAYWQTEPRLVSTTALARQLVSKYRFKEEPLPAQVAEVFRYHLERNLKWFLQSKTRDGPLEITWLNSFVRIAAEGYPVTSPLEPDLIKILVHPKVEAETKILIAKMFVADGIMRGGALAQRHGPILVEQEQLAAINAPHFPEKRQLQALLQKALNDVEIPVDRAQAKDLLAGYVRQLDSNDWSARNRAVFSMAKLLPESERHLGRALRDPHSRVRITALKALLVHYATNPSLDERQLNDAASRLMPSLIENLNPYGTEWLSSQAILLIGEFAIPYLQQSAQGNDTWLAARSTRLLKSIRSTAQ